MTLELPTTQSTTGTWITGIESWQDGVPTASMQLPLQGLPLRRALASPVRNRTAAGSRARTAWRARRIRRDARKFRGIRERRDGAIARSERRSTRTALPLAGRLRRGASKVARATGICRSRAVTTPQTFALADVEVDWALPRGPIYRFGWSDTGRATSSAVAVPVRSSAQRYRLSAVVSSEEIAAQLAATAAPDLEQIGRLMLPALP